MIEEEPVRDHVGETWRPAAGCPCILFSPVHQHASSVTEMSRLKLPQQRVYIQPPCRPGPRRGARSTAQEKIRALTRVQRKKYVIHPQTLALNADKWYQHYTRTAYLSGVPEKYAASTNAESAPVVGESVLSEGRSVARNSILQEHWYVKKESAFIHKEQEQFATPFLRNMVCGLKNLLAKENPVLSRSSLDFDPQVSYYWLRGERTVAEGPRRFQIDDKPQSDQDPAAAS
ncbi:28S ribosomal protein S30, mitochondrial-like [Sinocyclocheilus grahami]|uniref:28S ribosomal protein S30, mitochondrial-like n=1 Tax=Sinocyclocheilus grahami TaxID=75366 RepID=UPI0007AC547C|nr:PREDICTED: 28S ribosomal protein S30, mitochondrial-like [Sinocyclocheilus grahami]